MEGHEGTVDGCAVLPDGRFLSWGNDGTVRLWAAGGWEVVKVTAHDDGHSLGGLLLLDDHVITWPLSYGNRPNVFCLWSLDDVSLVRIYEGHDGPIESVIEYPGSRLVSSAQDGTAHLVTQQ